ncbi:MAG: hypothetical protein IPI60_16960 [Saprospiraceae bacterium]|jgi:hypothetical protein|nr:hypothetical protein [Saprospiraceae bacterium]
MENFDNSSFRRGDQTLQESSNSPIPGVLSPNPSLIQDKSFREFIKTNLKRPKVSQEFIQSIKDKIRLA